MPFQKNNKLGAKRIEAEPFEDQCISVRGRQGQKANLAAVPEWRTKLRDAIDRIIAEYQADADRL